VLTLLVAHAAATARAAAPSVEAVAHAIRAEALRANHDPAGRPLPLAAHWNRGQFPEGFSPAWQLEMIEAGHHLLPWFAQPNIDETMDQKFPGNRAARDYYEGPMRRCAALRLPISLVGTQWEATLYTDDRFKDMPPDETPRLVSLEGKSVKKLSPVGPVKWWREVGRQWTSSPAMKALQEWYPEPPLVLFVSNHEAADGDFDEDRRWVDAHGAGRDWAYKMEHSGGGYPARYRALLEGMREGLAGDAWRRAARFVGYGIAPAPSHFGRWGGWRQYSHYTPGGPMEWETAVWDGGSPSYYLHNWMPITDFEVWSPQVEAMNWVAFREAETNRTRPDFWFEFSTWDGDIGDKGKKSKRQWYAEQGQDFTPERYAAMVQFGLWLVRPRAVREFRGWVETREKQAAWFEAIVAAVDRVYASPVLTEFWRRGTLVANPAAAHPYQAAIPPQYKDLPRWYLLETSLDPLRPWKLKTPLPVFALAHVLGERPARRWLVYAYAPLGDRKAVRVTLPDHGPVTLDAPVAGAFCVVDEATGRVWQAP
jgi:hypothetical protein